MSLDVGRWKPENLNFIGFFSKQHLKPEIESENLKLHYFIKHYLAMASQIGSCDLGKLNF